jgi:hypothetical protein
MVRAGGVNSDFSELYRKGSASSLSSIWVYFLEKGNENMMLCQMVVRCCLKHRT